MPTEGRPLVPCAVVEGSALAGPAVPVVGYTTRPDGATVEGGPALPVVVISDAQVAAGYPVRGGAAVPMVLASAVGTRAALGQRAQPVYVVSGSLDPTPPTPVIPAGAFARYTYAEGSGQYVLNREAADLTPPVNLFGAPEALAEGNAPGWNASGVTLTPNAGTDPLGGNNAIRAQGAAGGLRYLYQSVPLADGAHTVSLWVKSNTGSPQTFRMSLSNGAWWSANLTATTSWQRITYTTTPGAGTTGRIPLASDDASNAYDLLIYGPQLEAGSTASTYPAQLGHATLGIAGAADSQDPAWGSGYLGMQGYKLALGSLSTPVSTDRISAYAVGRWTGTPVLAGYAPMIGELADSKLLLSAVHTAAGSRFTFNGSSVSALLANLDDDAWHCLAGTYDGTTLRLYIDGYLVASAAASISAVTLRHIVHGLIAGSAYWPGDLAYSAIYAAAHDAATVRSATQALIAELAARGLTMSLMDALVAAEGDSITEGGYPRIAIAIAPPVAIGAPFAVSGSTIADLTSRAASVDALYDSTRRKNILSVLIGRNDLLSLGTSTWLANLQTYCEARRAVGWEILLCTLLPSTAGGFNTARATANTAIRAASYADAVCDFAADATMGPDAAASNTTYYSDGTHPTTAGQTLLAAVWRAAVAGML